MSFEQLMEKKLLSSAKDESKQFYELCFFMAKEFGWSYSQMMETPIPFVLGICDESKKYYKKVESVKRRK